MLINDSICALATPQGVGAIAIIRVSGSDCISIVNRIFFGKNLEKVPGNTVHFGLIKDQEKIIDEVLVTVFKSPRSFTKEDSVEISTHGSDYIVKYVLSLLVKNGCRMALPGEFTQRAFLNGQFDLTQAEAVADLIAADSAAAHQIALEQLRGGFSNKLSSLREELIHFASLVELELDFGEEDVEFADRDDLKELIFKILKQINPLIDSFESGNAIKEGIPVAIIGAPNAGKSTLLNALLNEEKAIVTEIAGTTRDVIEDVLYINGQKFRFIDTAGIRHTTDKVESIGIERSKKALTSAKIVLMIYDNLADLEYIKQILSHNPTTSKVIWVKNKIDLTENQIEYDSDIEGEKIAISAKEQMGIEELKNKIVGISNLQSSQDTTISNVRHFEHLLKTQEALEEVLTGLDMGVTGDFLAQDIRLSLHHLGQITGQITTDDLLGNIFGKFCIGK